MIHLPLKTALAAALAVAFMAGAQAQPATSTSTQSSTTSSGSTATGAADRGTTGSHAGRDNKLAHADSAFLKQAAQNGHAEVESSKLALTKASNEKVKAFAQQMVDDHTKNNEELAALAKSKGVDVPTEPSLMQKGKMKLLEHSDGQDFDRRYVESMGVKAHEDTINLFRKGAADAKDPDVKAFAEKTLPKLEHHLQMAQELHTSMGGKSSGKSKK